MGYQQDNILMIQRIKRDGKLVFRNAGQETWYNEFVENLQEGQITQEFIEAFKDDATNTQLAKVHVCIKKIAAEQGETVREVKCQVKEMAGLRYRLSTTEWYEKSFGDCSKEEISLTMETIKEIGGFLGISF